MSKALRLIVAVLIAATVLLTVAQRFWTASPWWLELTRYLPFLIYLTPPACACLLAIALGRAWRLASLAALALVAVVAMDLRLHLPADASTVAEQGPHFRLMTYNIKAYIAVKKPGGMDALAREVALHDPDILVMQDVQREHGGAPFDPTQPIFGLPNVFLGDHYAVASRLPLAGCRIERTDPGQLNFVVCNVEVGGRRLDLITVHFESPRSGLMATRREGIDGANDWQLNVAERRVQALGLATKLENALRPLVVAGDLNAPEASPVVRTLTALDLRDAFASAGNGWGYTYGHALASRISFLRIDHILVSPDITVLNCIVGSKEGSEHRPVIADLVLRRR